MNNVLNYVDFAVIMTVLLSFIITVFSSQAIDDAPIATLFLFAQLPMLYFSLRVRFAIQLPFIWCSTCTEHRHMQFLFWHGMFQVIIIAGEVYDIFRSMLGKNGLA